MKSVSRPCQIRMAASTWCWCPAWPSRLPERGLEGLSVWWAPTSIYVGSFRLPLSPFLSSVNYWQCSQLDWRKIVWNLLIIHSYVATLLKVIRKWAMTVLHPFAAGYVLVLLIFCPCCVGSTSNASLISVYGSSDYFVFLYNLFKWHSFSVCTSKINQTSLWLVPGAKATTTIT